MNKNIIILIYNIIPNDLINKFIKYNIFYSDLIIKDNNIYIKININDLDKIKKIFKNKQIIIVEYKGILYLKYILEKHFIFILSLFFSYFVILVLSNLIFFIEIKTDNKDLKKYLIKELENYDIKKYKFKKSYKEISKIKEDILNNAKDKIEWLEIKENGVKYIVELTERKIKSVPNKEKVSNIVAKKDALIKKIITTKGVKMKNVNEYVKKGEVLISGEIKKEEELKDIVVSKGKVFGEVWYTVNTVIPYEYIEYVPTGEVVDHYYIEFLNNKMTLLGRYNAKYYIYTTKILIDKPYMFFRLVKEKKEMYKYSKIFLSQNEALEEAIRRSEKSIKAKLTDEEYIISKKILKKNIYNSKIEVELFYRVYENIGMVEEINTDINVKKD